MKESSFRQSLFRLGYEYELDLVPLKKTRKSHRIPGERCIFGLSKSPARNKHTHTETCNVNSFVACSFVCLFWGVPVRHIENGLFLFLFFSKKSELVFGGEMCQPRLLGNPDPEPCSM